MILFFSILLVLIIIIIALFFIIYRAHNYYKKYEYARELRFILVSEIYNDLKSGDIILYKANAVQLEHVLFTHSFFTHIGMIIKDNKTNELYITESNPPNVEVVPISHYNGEWYELNPNINYQMGITINGSGANIIPLKPRLKYFAGDYYLMRLNKNLTDNQELELINDTTKIIKYPKFTQMISNLIKEEILNIHKKKEMHCFEYMGYLLDKMKITNNISLNNTINICNTISQIYNKELNNGYFYETPIKLIYDI